MKFLVFLAASFTVACANNVWTIQQLADAIMSPHMDDNLRPYLEAALNQTMSDLWSGQQVDAVTVSINPKDFISLTLEQISAALEDPKTDPAFIPYLEAALDKIMDDLFSGKPVESAVVSAPTMEIHYYSLQELSEALQDPNTNEGLFPYLENALSDMMEYLFAGEDINAIVITVPAGLIAVVPKVIPSPVDLIDGPEVPVVPDGPVVPDVPIALEAPASPAVHASPLVQIILNFNKQSAEEIAAIPVHVVDTATVAPFDAIDDTPTVVKPVVQRIESVEIPPIVVKPASILPVIISTPSFHDVYINHSG